MTIPLGVLLSKSNYNIDFKMQALETSLKTWEEKQRNTLNAISHSASTIDSTQLQLQSQSKSHLPVHSKPSHLNEEEMYILLGFIEVVTTLVKWVKLLIISHPSLEADLYQVAARTAQALEQVHPGGKILQGVSSFLIIKFLVFSLI